MSTKKSSKVRTEKQVSDKEASDRIEARRATTAVPTPRSAPKASAVDIAQEKRAIAAESNQQKSLREAYQAQEAAAKDRQAQGKRAAEAQKKAGPPDPRFGAVSTSAAFEPGKVFVVDNPTGDYLEFTFRGETIVLKPGSNEFGDNYLPGVKGEDIAAQAIAFHGFTSSVSNKSKADAKKSTKPGDEIKLPDETAGALAFPDTLRDKIKSVSNPSADERAQPFRFPATTEHDPQGVKTRATKDSVATMLDEESGDGKKSTKKSARVTGSKR